GGAWRAPRWRCAAGSAPRWRRPPGGASATCSPNRGRPAGTPPPCAAGWGSRSGSGRCPTSGVGSFLDVLLVALGLEVLGQFLAALGHDAAVDEDVHEGGLDVAQDARVVRDQHDGAVALRR